MTRARSVAAILFAALSVAATPALAETRPAERPALQTATGGLARSLRPVERPATLQRKVTAQRTGTPGYRPSGVPGAICGRQGIRGVAIKPIPGRIKGCGVAQPVSVSMVAGVGLSQAATMDCGTARALESWVLNSVGPAFSKLNGGIRRLQVAAHYSCRTRNNRPGAKISEHGRGRAIDISAFQLNDGTTITVLSHWNDRRFGPVLKRLNKGACGPFGTVLGPGSDGHHRDHLHMDTARYRSGTYCR